jgi:RNA polymerase sigma-70 factor, ECF subfamily
MHFVICLADCEQRNADRDTPAAKFTCFLTLILFTQEILYIEDLTVIATVPALEEKQAIARLKQGDLDGMECLVRQHQDRAVSAAYLIVRDLALAEDIVESSFLNAAQKIEQFDERRPFGPWFLRSVIHASIKAVNRQNRQVSLDEEAVDETRPWVDLLLDPNPQPGEIVETRETREMVWKALYQLTPEQRGAVVMRHFLDMDAQEMIQLSGRPETTVRWWLRTARKRLAVLLRPMWLSGQPEMQDEKDE